MLERMWSEGNTPPLVVGVQTCTTTLEINVIVSQRNGISLPQDPVIPILGIYPKKIQSYYKNTCSTMFIAALFITTRAWKLPKCPSTEESVRTMWSIYTMEYHSTVRTDLMKSLGKWMELEKNHSE